MKIFVKNSDIPKTCYECKFKQDPADSTAVLGCPLINYDQNEEQAKNKTDCPLKSLERHDASKRRSHKWKTF